MARTRSRLLLSMASIGLLVLALALLPHLSQLSVEPGVPATEPHSFSERPPFGRPLDGALAYLSDDRSFILVDLTTGQIIGSKGIPTERRPAGASATRAFLGSVPAGRIDGNWDRYKSLPWDGTVYRNDARGMSVAYDPTTDVVAAAMQPLPEGGNGVVLTSAESSQTVLSSAGHWRFATWVGERVLVRELVGDRVNWWLITMDGDASTVPLPADFKPIAGTSDGVFGHIEGRGAIIRLATAEVSLVESQSSWAAAWQPGGDRLATLGEDATLFVYSRDGSLAWSVPLEEPVTRFRGGLAWGPDGSFLVVSAGGTLQALTENGELIGELSTGVPEPQSAPGAAFLTVVEAPPSASGA
jgi:hypothetical protein